MIKVGINGFGRIGRLVARIILQKYSQSLDLVCINTSGKIDPSGWAHLFTYDSAYGKYKGKVEAKDNKMIVEGKEIYILGERNPAKIYWEKYGVQIVIEATGVFRREQDARLHLRGSVKKVILSAPPKEGNIKMFVIGINEDKLNKEDIISCASCTTNCAAPVIKVMEENFGIAKALMTTIHAYTSDQRLLDGSHKDWRRGRSAAVNIVPTSTGAAKATAKVYPKIANIFDGLAVRVPVITGSLTDFTIMTKKNTSVEKINQAFAQAAKKELKGILGVTNELLVSQDIIGLPLSCLVDLSLTMVVGGNLVKVVAWYDNEWGYANRLAEEVVLLGKDLA